MALGQAGPARIAAGRADDFELNCAIECGKYLKSNSRALNLRLEFGRELTIPLYRRIFPNLRHRRLTKRSEETWRL